MNGDRPEAQFVDPLPEPRQLLRRRGTPLPGGRIVDEDLDGVGADRVRSIGRLYQAGSEGQMGAEPAAVGEHPGHRNRATPDLTDIKSNAYAGVAMDQELLTTLKALSDASRLRIIGLLVERPHAVEELADALRLAPGTVVHHLKRLRAAGLVDAEARRPYVEYSLRIDRLHAVGRMLDRLERDTEPAASLPGPDGAALPAFDAKVLRSFFDGGRLREIPAQDKKRQVVLRYLLDRVFTEERAYPEKEVNQRLALYHPDVAALRRYMVDARLVTRAAGLYRRA
jgi:DNA-binding HxlR family transcriptional regulator